MEGKVLRWSEEIIFFLILIFSVWQNRACFKDQRKATSAENVREKVESYWNGVLRVRRICLNPREAYMEMFMESYPCCALIYYIVPLIMHICLAFGKNPLSQI